MSCQEEEIGNEFKVMQEKIKKKQFACSLAEAEYSKLNDQSEKFAKMLETLKEKNSLCENLMKTYECRLREYEKTEKEYEKDISEAKNSVAELKLSISEVQKEMQMEDKLFFEEVKQLAAKLCSERDSSNKNSLKEQIGGKHKESHVLDKEVEDMKRLLSEIKTKHPILPTSQESVIQNCLNEIPYVREKIKVLKKEKLLLDGKEKDLGKKKNLNLFEIKKMEEQL